MFLKLGPGSLEWLRPRALALEARVLTPLSFVHLVGMARTGKKPLFGKWKLGDEKFEVILNHTVNSRPVWVI